MGVFGIGKKAHSVDEPPQSALMAADLLYLAADMATFPDGRVRAFADRAGTIAHTLLVEAGMIPDPKAAVKATEKSAEKPPVAAEERRRPKRGLYDDHGNKLPHPKYINNERTRLSGISWENNCQCGHSDLAGRGGALGRERPPGREGELP